MGRTLSGPHLVKRQIGFSQIDPKRQYLFSVERHCGPIMSAAAPFLVFHVKLSRSQ